MALPRLLPAFPRKAVLRLALALVPVPALAAVASWYLTEPLGDPTRPVTSLASLGDSRWTECGDASPADGSDSAAVASAPCARQTPAVVAEPATWPDERMDGEAAKRRLLAILLPVQERLENAEGFTATFRKQERIDGELQPRQTMAMKVRNEPFSVYLKFLAPKAGKEVIYCEGRFDNHLIGHNGDWSRLLVPRLKISPTDAMALTDNRHPITDAGLLNLVNKLVRYRRMDLGDPVAETVLDRYTDEEGRPWCRSLHTHAHYDPSRPFTYVEVLYDPETLIPLSIAGYDWPEPGSDAEPQLGEWYVYEDVEFDADLDDKDFDPANEEYAFTRF